MLFFLFSPNKKIQLRGVKVKLNDLFLLKCVRLAHHKVHMNENYNNTKKKITKEKDEDKERRRRSITVPGIGVESIANINIYTAIGLIGISLVACLYLLVRNVGRVTTAIGLIENSLMTLSRPVGARCWKSCNTASHLIDSDFSLYGRKKGELFSRSHRQSVRA